MNTRARLQMHVGMLSVLVLLQTVAIAAEPPGIPDGWSDGFVYANGIRIHYYHAAPAPGKPVILAIHGVMDTGLTWASVANRLQDDYDIYMLDTRGHGLSDPFTASDDRNTMITDVVEAAKALGLEKPILMGHSMGGAAVIRLGAEYPDFARAIIVVDAGISAPRFQGNRRSGNPSPSPPPPASSDSLAITMWGSPEALVAQNNYSFDDLVAKAHRDNPRWSMMDCRYWAIAIKRYHGPYTQELWQAMSGSMRGDDALAKIPVPTIILKADAPRETRQAHQEAASVMQNGTLVHIDNSAHNVQRDQPERAAQVIREFLSTNVPGVGLTQQTAPVRTEHGLAQGTTELPGIPDGWSERFVYANGIRIHYCHATPAPGKPVIMAIHGVMDTGLAWASVANRLQNDYDIYMLDTRGHGLSDPFTGSEDSDALLKDVLEVAEKLGIEKPILMGHSMGGGTVIRLGAEYPDFAKAIIVVDAGISGPRPQGNRGNRRSGNPSPPPSPSSDPMPVTMGGPPEAVVAQNNYSFDDLVAKAHRENPRWSMMDCRYWATAIKRYHGTYPNGVRQARSGSMRSENPLTKIQVPMIILKADAPPETRQAHQEAASVMQNGTLVHIDNSAHNVQRDQPDRAAQVIREFLSTKVSGIGSAQQPAPVRTEYGLVQGVTEPGLTVYRGVPFAAPPVGDLRWRPPQPATPWDGVRDATEFAPDPYQGNGRGNVSEDCLYLNVWTPAKSADEHLPVLVWIYGGGFTSGHTSGPGENGEYLARKGVVLVSINYRVGQLGFLAHPELSAESPHHVSGNYGLLDQIAGLRWIQKNIEAFGGDPDRVTIFGESAGGISVSMLCASPFAKGLIHGAISESGGSFGPPSSTRNPGENMQLLASAERSGEALVQQLGASSIAELRQLEPGQIRGGRGAGVSWPIVDGWVIPDDQYKLYEAGQYNDVPVIVGYNSDEGLTFSRERTPEDYIANVRSRFGPFADRLIAAYPPGETTVPRSARNLMRDTAFGWHTWTWARLQARTGDSKVFYYYFDQHPERDPDSPEADHGTAHGPEVSYVFQVLKDLQKPGDPELTPADLAISDTISTYWVNFAKHGNPNGPGVPEWPQFTEQNRQVMYFHDKAFPGPVPSVEGLEALDAYFAWRRTQDGAAK